MRERKLIISTLSYVFLIISSLVMIYPVVFMMLGAFTTKERFAEAVILPIPNSLNLDIITRSLRQGIWDSYLFTLLRVGFYIVVTNVVGLIGGYIFSKLNFPGKNKVFLLFLSGMVMPALLMLVPQYLMMAWWPNTGGNNWLGQGGHGLIGNIWVLFSFGWVPPFAIFVLKQSFDMLPSEYEDAAKIDGAGIFTIIFRVYGPLLKPPIVALTILTFLGVWADYLWPSFTVAGHEELYPIALRMKTLLIAEVSSSGIVDYPSILIKTFLATWPPAAVYFLLQRYFVQGLVGSGLKG